MSRFLPALCAAASVAAVPISSFAQTVSGPPAADPARTVVAAASNATGSGQSPLPPVVVSAPTPRKPKAARSAQRPARTTRRTQAVRTPSPESKPATEVGSSQYGAGPGGRFTGYTVDYDAPAMAGKDNTPILQTPANVQVVTRQAMDDRQDISVRDAIVGYVSSVQPPSNTPSSNNFYDGFNIRGFDNVNIYRNNLRVWELTGIQTSNLQSIEILKGPAAMLYGRLEPGGIVDLIPKRPLDYSYTSIQQQFGSWGLSRTTIDTTGPVTADKTWLYRVNLAYDRADSFIDFVNSKNVFIAPTLTFRPNDQFRFNIDYEYQHSEFVDKSMGIPAVGNRPAPVPISRYLQEPAYTQANPNTQDRHLVGFDWTYDFNKDWSLTNRFAFNDQRYGQHQYGTASFTEATGVVDRWIWDANIQARTFATNLDLKEIGRAHV